MEEIKPGIKTSEFWSKTLIQAITLGASAYAMYHGVPVTPDQQAHIAQVAIMAIGGIEAAYTFSRGLVKKQ